MLKIELINDYEKFLALEPVWNQTLAKSDIDIPYMTFEWFASWWKSYQGDNSLFILLVKEGDEILGIAPLMTQKIKFRGLPVKAVKFICNDQTSRAGFISSERHEAVLGAIIDFLLKQAPKAKLITLDFIEDATSSTLALNEVLCKKNIKYRKIEGYASPYIRIEGDWENYAKGLTKSFRKNIKRVKKRVQNTGDYVIEKYTGDNVGKGFEELLAVSEMSWQHQNGTAIASSEREKAFYFSLAQKASQNDWLNLSICKLDGVPIAYEFALRYKSRNYSLKSGYNQEYRKLSPSMFLDTFTIPESFATGDAEYEFMGISDDYKMRWTDKIRHHSNYWIFGNGFYGGLLTFLELGFVNTVRKILSNKNNECT